MPPGRPSGRGIRRPGAIGGLASSTFPTLAVIPAIYAPVAAARLGRVRARG
jgi:Cu/Ag efflux pump CusA